MSLDGVLDRQGVQPELASDRGELLFGRVVETYSCQPVPLPASLVGLAYRGGFRRPATVDVDGVVHDHGVIIRPPTRSRSRKRRKRERLAETSSNLGEHTSMSFG